MKLTIWLVVGLSLTLEGCATIPSQNPYGSNLNVYYIDKTKVEISESEVSRLRTLWKGLEVQSSLESSDFEWSLRYIALYESKIFYCESLELTQVNPGPSPLMFTLPVHGKWVRPPSYWETWIVKACDKNHSYAIIGDSSSLDIVFRK